MSTGCCLSSLPSFQRLEPLIYFLSLQMFTVDTPLKLFFPVWIQRPIHVVECTNISLIVMARQCYVIMRNKTYQLINIWLFPALSSYCESCCTGHSYKKKMKILFDLFWDRVLLFQPWGLSCLSFLHGCRAGAHHPTKNSRTSFPKDIRFIIILGIYLGVGSLDYTEI